MTNAVTVETQKKYTVDLYYDPQYTITFKYNDDGATSDQTQKAFKDTTLLTPTPSTRPGYTFNGWKKEGPTDDLLQGGTNITVTGDATYIAQWTKDPVDAEATVSLNDWTYDGTAAGSTQHPVTATRDGQEVRPNHFVWKDADGKILASAPVNAGKYTLEVSWDADGSYKATSASCTFTISKRNVTLTSADDNKPYDGTPLTHPGVTITGDGFVDGDYTVAATGTITDVGEQTNTISATPKDAATAGNYNITFDEGKLTVSPKDISKPDSPATPDKDKTGITVTPPADVKYNGNKQEQKPTVKDAKTGKTLVEGTDYDLKYSDDTTNAGTVTVTITGKGNYSGTTETTYQINKRDVTLTSDSANKPYDGTPLTRPDVTITGDGFVDGDYTVKATGTITDVGEQTNTISATPKDEKTAGNYNITVKEGTLTVSPKDISKPDSPITPDKDKTGITVTPPTDVKYNGNKQEQKPTVKDAKTGKTLIEGTDYDLKYSDDTTNAGTVTVTITGKGNYSDTTETAYQINKRDVTLTSDSANKPYDGAPLTRPDVTITGDGFVDGDYTITATGTITNVGEQTNTISATPKDAATAGNYNITFDEGKLAVSPKDISKPDSPATPDKDKTGITVTPPDDTIYNGQEQKKAPVVKDGDRVLKEGKDYELSYSEDVTNPGTVTVTITGIGNYTEKTSVTYRILPVSTQPAEPAKPTKPQQPAQSTPAPAQSTKAAKTAPKTADNAHIGTAAGLLAVSTAALAVLLRRRKNEQ